MNPPTPPNSAPSPERPAGVPERFQPATGMEQAPVPEAAESQPQVQADRDAPVGQSSLVPPLPAPGAPVVGPAGGGVAGGTGTTGPASAADVDVIEPEWVEKAEQTVRSHYGDPYGEEEAVEDLQVDYLKKRYGYNVADPNGEKNKSEGT